MSKTKFVSALLMSAIAFAGTATAKDSDNDGKVVVGLMADMGGVYSALSGPGSLEAARMAIEDFGGKIGDKPIELLSADYQLKVDIGLSIAKRWIENDGVDMIIEGTDSATAGGLFDLGEKTETVTIAASAASTGLSNAHCSPYGTHYVYDTFALATGTGGALVDEGFKDWYFITVDYAFGHSLEANTSAVVLAKGGNIVGGVRVPLSTADYASYLLQAQASGAQVVALANAGGDFVNSLKQASEFGIVAGGQKIAAMLVFISDVKALGLDVAQGLTFTSGFYWDMNDETRAWSDRFYDSMNARPTMVQAGTYSAVTHYLKAVEAVGNENAAEVTAWMRSNPINDFFAKNGTIREDGRMVHDMYLVQVKTPAESTSDWDLLKVLRTIPGVEAFNSLENSTCDLL